MRIGGSRVDDFPIGWIKQRLSSSFQIAHMSRTAGNPTDLFSKVRCLLARDSITRGQQHQHGCQDRPGPATNRFRKLSAGAGAAVFANLTILLIFGHDRSDFHIPHLMPQRIGIERWGRKRFPTAAAVIRETRYDLGTLFRAKLTKHTRDSCIEQIFQEWFIFEWRRVGQIPGV